MKTRLLLIFLGFAVLLGAPFAVPMFSLWSRINCREQEVDVHSGLRRDTRYIYWIPVSRKVTDTPLSAARSNVSSTRIEPQWESVNTFGPYTRHSPHYIYHAAFSQIRQLELLWTEFEFDVVKRRDSARGLRREWQTTHSDSSADAYIQQQMKTAEQAGTGQPATRPESKSEGGDKPQPEAEGRSR
jgi:hypothetical protein